MLFLASAALAHDYPILCNRHIGASLTRDEPLRGTSGCIQRMAIDGAPSVLPTHIRTTKVAPLIPKVTLSGRMGVTGGTQGGGDEEVDFWDGMQ